MGQRNLFTARKLWQMKLNHKKAPNKSTVLRYQLLDNFPATFSFMVSQSAIWSCMYHDFTLLRPKADYFLLFPAWRPTVCCPIKYTVTCKSIAKQRPQYKQATILEQCFLCVHSDVTQQWVAVTWSHELEVGLWRLSVWLEDLVTVRLL
jgi:hypothetical protein